MTKITSSLLDHLYESIANSKPQPKFCYFQGIKYKTRSNPLKSAIKKWKEDNLNK